MRPGAVATLGRGDPLGDGDLLLTAVLVGYDRSRRTPPGAQAELQPAVVAVAGVGGPVAAGLALGDPVPDEPLADDDGVAGAAGSTLVPTLTIEATGWRTVRERTTLRATTSPLRKRTR